MEPIDMEAFKDMSLSDYSEEENKVVDRAEKLCLHGTPFIAPSPTKAGYTAWVVFNGRINGVFESWSATWAQVGGFSNGNQRGFRTRGDAQAAWDHALANGTVGPPRPTIPVGVASIPLSTPSHNVLPSRSQTPRTLQSGLALPMAQSTPERASRQHINMPLSPSIPQTTRGNWQLPTLSESGAPVLGSPHPVISTQPRTQNRLSDEDAYWVVVNGANLGVYHGRAAATTAMGSHEPRKLLKTGSRDHANRVFVEAYMAGDLVEVYVE